jgi:hypothetical protein
MTFKNKSNRIIKYILTLGVNIGLSKKN